MRLEVLHTGHRPIQRLLSRPMRQPNGSLPGPVAVMSYRRALHGKYFSKAFQECMRKKKHWTIGDVELFASFVSKQNECVY
ncbi:MAG: hypothetical protein ACRD0U_02955 [Acidimicrobiales bacterium]